MARGSTLVKGREMLSMSTATWAAGRRISSMASGSVFMNEAISTLGIGRLGRGTGKVHSSSVKGTDTQACGPKTRCTALGSYSQVTGSSLKESSVTTSSTGKERLSTLMGRSTLSSGTTVLSSLTRNLGPTAIIPRVNRRKRNTAIGAGLFLGSLRIKQ